MTLVLALLACAFAFRDLTVRMTGAWIVAFVAPFALIICYFDRYRAPIEPLIAMLALFGISRALARLRARTLIAQTQ